MYFVYLLKCKDGSIYTGITNDLDERMRKHRAGIASKYTRSRGFAKLLYVEEYGTKGGALRREAEIKRWKRDKKLFLARSAHAGNR